jgi:addiction module HigA family antidote
MQNIKWSLVAHECGESHGRIQSQARPRSLPFSPRSGSERHHAFVGKPKAGIARLLGISPQHLHEILEEKKPVRPNVAARIGKLIGNGPAIWLRLQAAYHAWHAEREVDVSKIPTLEQA